MPPVSALTARPRHWGRWVLFGLALLLLAALGWLKWGLDPWLRRKLEAQVTTQTHGQYALAVGTLQTHLLARRLHLGSLRHPATATRPPPPCPASRLGRPAST